MALVPQRKVEFDQAVAGISVLAQHGIFEPSMVLKHDGERRHVFEI
jgi:hypothetical protein